MRAAEAVGDVTGPAMALFYARFPNSRADFEALSVGHPASLEGEMVESVLYCLMHWRDRPREIESLFAETVSHHVVTLGLAPAAFSGLVEAVIDVILAAVPPEAGEERALWAAMRRDLAYLVEANRTY